MSHHELTLAGLHIDGIASEVHDEGWLLRVLSSGTTLGTSEPVVSVMQSLSADGAASRVDAWGNATSTIQVQVSGADHTALALGEAALRRVLPDGWGDPVDLVWRPPDGMAPASVRVVLSAVLGSPFSDGWDQGEMRYTRTYPLTLTHRPHVYSEHETVAPALPVGSGAITVIDPLSSTSGWSWRAGSGNAQTPTTTGIALQFAHPPATERLWLITRTGVVSFTGTPYLVADIGSTRNPFPTVYGVSSGGSGARPISVTYIGGGYWRHVFYVGEAARPELSFAVHSVTPSALPETISIKALERHPVNPGTPRQRARIIAVGGTERSMGSLHISAPAATPAAPLGLTLVHTSPGSGDEVDLAAWLTLGTVDTVGYGAPAGTWWTLSSSLRSEVPWNALTPDAYQLGIIAVSDTTQQVRLKWDTSAVIGATVTPQDGGERIVDLVAGRMTWVALGRTTLPAARTRRGTTRVEVVKTAGAGKVVAGGFYAFRSGRNCALTVVDPCDEPHLFIDSGDGANNPGSWMVGDAADGSDAYTPPNFTPGIHAFPPGELFTYVVTAGVEHPDVALRHRRAWTANAADDGTT